jgi:WD40 repeat protein
MQVWDYEMKLLMNLKEFNSVSASTLKNNTAAARIEALNFLRPQSVVFDPKGDFVAVGFTSGHVKLLDVETLEDIASYAPTAAAVSGVKFSPSGIYLAAFDSAHHVLIFQRTDTVDLETLGDEVNQEQKLYTYLGRSHAHDAPITGIEFGTREGLDTLISVGENRRSVEFDLQICSVINGIHIIMDDPYQTLELTAIPTAVIWCPQSTHMAEDGQEVTTGEDKFIVATDEFKIKEYNLDSKSCRKTALSPMFGGPVTQMIGIPTEEGVSHYAYSTAEKVIGLGRLPVSGDPAENMGLVAHPGAVSALAVSSAGDFVFSAGGSDLSVNMWRVDTSDLTAPHTKTQTETMSSFLALLEGGENGPLHQDIVDHFYYSQLRAQGESSMEKRDITGVVPVGEIPSLVRAVGYYPSEQEVANMINEVRFSTFLVTGQHTETISLDDFIKLYINHRPVVPLNNKQVLKAFETIFGHVGVSEENAISWEDLRNALVSEGEAIMSTDLEAYLTALIGKEARQLGGQYFNAEKFANNVLGFEDFLST